MQWWESNSRPLNYKSNVLTTTPPRHRLIPLLCSVLAVLFHSWDGYPACSNSHVSSPKDSSGDTLRHSRSIKISRTVSRFSASDSFPTLMLYKFTYLLASWTEPKLWMGVVWLHRQTVAASHRWAAAADQGCRHGRTSANCCLWSVRQ